MKKKYVREHQSHLNNSQKTTKVGVKFSLPISYANTHLQAFQKRENNIKQKEAFLTLTNMAVIFANF